MTEPEAVHRARNLMAAGSSMKEAAMILGILPSSRLDALLWRYLGTDLTDVVEGRFKQPEPMW